MAAAPGGRILLIAAGVACIMVAVAFFGVAIFILLQPALNVAGAAAVTAFVLLLVPAGWMLWKKLSPPPRRVSNPETSALTMLAGMARDQPLLAVLGACLFGMADYLLRHRNKKSKPGVLF